MHILVGQSSFTVSLTNRSPQVVNDDGPPDTPLCPYLRPLVEALNKAGHRTSVVLPDHSRSWIGKAHIIGQALTATYCTLDDSGLDWVLVDGTPASCVQLGLFDLFTDRPPIDLVVSGPNHGRNASTIYNLSSGTVGGALEAAQCGKRAIALSFASKDLQPTEIIAAAARHAARLISQLGVCWPKSVELLNINIPMRADVENRPVLYSQSVSSYWSKRSLFSEVQVSDKNSSPTNGHITKTKHFAWMPELSDIKLATRNSLPGTDMWTLEQGYSSVTPLRANFEHIEGFQGEVVPRC